MDGSSPQQPPRHLLQTLDLTPSEITALLDRADTFRASPDANPDLLRGATVACYFAKPSTRTRLSFGAAIARLGGTPQMLSAGDLQIGRGETIEDTARVMSRYLSAFVIRTFAHDDVERFAAASSIPVVNALTDSHHPCQSLADLMTIRAHFGSLAGLVHAYVGDGNNVAHSLAEAGALSSMHVVLACPPGYQPDTVIIERAAEVAELHGGSVRLVDDAREAVAGANIVSTDVWLSMGDSDATRIARYEALRPYQVNRELMAAADGDAIFLHCLPAHRDDEVTAEIIDGPRSLVFDQAENRLWTQQALLEWLITG
jgi:ornithine carbamoyltransferase